MLKVSVIIPTCNRANLLERAIRSVFSQTYRDFEIIVVDDASTDNTQEVVMEKFKHEIDAGILRYVRNEINRERSYSRNRGMEMAKGEYIALLDDDDIWLPEHIANLFEYINKDPSIKCVFSKPLWIYEEGFVEDKFNRLFPKLETGSGKLYRDMTIAGHLVFPQISLFEREVYENIGGFLSNIIPHEDWEFFSRLAMNYNIGYVNTVTCCIYARKGSYSQKTVGDYAYIKEDAWEIIKQNSIKYNYPLKDEVRGKILITLSHDFIPIMNKLREYLFKALKADYRLLKNKATWRLLFRSLLGRYFYTKLKHFKSLLKRTEQGI